MFPKKDRYLIVLCLTLFAGLLITVDLAGAQWGPANSPEGGKGRRTEYALDSNAAPNSAWVSATGNSTDTLTYLPLVSKNASGERLKVWADEARAPILRSLAAAFKQAYGADLDVIQVDNINPLIETAIPAGWGPDIFVGRHEWLGTWLEQGLVAGIDLGSTVTDFAPVTIDGFTSDGQLYGLPDTFENMGLVRNADMVPEAPKTWVELLTTGKDLQTSGDVSYTLALEDNGYKVYPIVTSFGGYVFGRESDGTWNVGNLGITSTGMISAGRWISANIEAGLISPIAHDANGAETLFESGQTPFIMTGPWALECFRSEGVNYAISPFPDNGLPFVGVQGFMISADSAKYDLAKTFLTDFVATAEIMELLYQSGPRMPAYLPLLTSIADPDLIAFFEAGAGGAPIPAVPEMGCVWGPWNAAVVHVIHGTKTPEEAFADAAEEIRICIMYGGPIPGMVNVPGSYQTLVGCADNWDPACFATAMTTTEGADVYTSTHDLPAGDYEAKVALNGSWFENYGLGGVRDGPNIPFSLPVPGTVHFTYDPETHILDIIIAP